MLNFSKNIDAAPRVDCIATTDARGEVVSSGKAWLKMKGVNDKVMKNQTNKVVNWFKGIWESHQYDKSTRDEIRERVQMDINVNHFTEEELDDLGFWGMG